MTAVLPDPLTDPAGYITAVAEIRERRAKDEVTDGWFTTGELMDHPGLDLADAEFVAFETPAHALAEVALWRAVVTAEECFGVEFRPVVAAVVAACRAYAGGQ